MSKLLGRGFAAAVAMTMAATALATSPAGAAEPTPGWTASVGSGGSVRYFDSATGPDGSVVLAGWNQSGSETDGVVRKLDASGNEVWKTLVGDEGAADYISAVDVAPDGSVVVAGRTRGDIGGRTGGTDFDAFVAKLSSTGAVLWAEQIGQNGTNNDDAGLGVAAATDGSVFLGAFVSFSDQPALLRFDSAGNEQWRYAYGAPGDIIEDMAYSQEYGAAYFTAVGPTGGLLSSASLAGTMSSETRVPGVTSLSVAIAPTSGDVVAGGDAYLGRFSFLGINMWANTSVPLDIGDIDVENDGSIVAFTTATSGASPALRGFTSTGSLESWSKPLASAVEGHVSATSDGGVVTSSTDSGYNTVSLARFNGSSTGGGSGGGSGTAGFTDVPPGAFYSEGVAFLKAEGITTGTSPTTYSPDDVVTRGQMAAFLHRLAGTPGGSPAHGFSDVPGGTFYADAVAWLKAEGITTGTTASTYSPNDVVTRGQMAAFLHRLAGSPDDNPGHGFSDVPANAFYRDAVAWLKDQGITTGTSASTYSPNDVVTRGQMAAFLYRMATDSDWTYPG
ncbi:MAG: S-layer homology domain-containing protein [Acidimicrobiales bacterium]